MRISEEYRRAGYFWLPSNEEHKIPGILTIRDGGEIKLKIIGHFEVCMEKLIAPSTIQRIVGLVEKDGYLTLDDCFYTKWNLPLGDIISISTLHANTAFSGIDFAQDEDVWLSTFIFSVECLDEWLGISGIRRSLPDDKREVSISFKPPEKIQYELKNGMTLFIMFSGAISAGRRTEAHVSQKAHFKLHSAEKRHFSEFRRIAHRLTMLVCFALDNITNLRDVQAIVDEEHVNNRQGNTRIELYYPSWPFQHKKPRINWRKSLFFLKHIEDGEALFNNWLDAYETFPEALDSYFSSARGGHKYSDDRFLSLVQGLETYHRKTHDSKLMDEQTFKDLVASLIESCPKEHKTWLESRLKYGNEVSLARRLKDVIAPFKCYFGNSRERNKLIRDIVDNRNFRTHWDGSIKEKAAHGKHFLNLYQKTKICFQLHLLQVLSFTKEDIARIFEETLAWQFAEYS